MTISTTLANILATLGITLADATAQLDALAVTFPDAAPFEAAVKAWIAEHAVHDLTPAGFAQLTAAIAAELVSGHPGYNPNAGAVA